MIFKPILGNAIMEKKTLGPFRGVVLALAFYFTASNLVFAQFSDQKGIIFYGYLREVLDCSVNNGQPILVSFGNVSINKIDSAKYVQDLHYTINCSSNYSDIGLVFDGTAASWDTTVAATNVEGLGVRILVNGAPYPLNAINGQIDINKLPTVQLLLVKDPNVALEEKPFTAALTLYIMYA